MALHPELIGLRIALASAKANLGDAVLRGEPEKVVRPLRLALSGARVALEAWADPDAPAPPAPAPKAPPAPTPAARPVKGRQPARAAAPAAAPARLPLSASLAAVQAERPAVAPVRPWRMSNRAPVAVAVETAATRAAAARASY